MFGRSAIYYTSIYVWLKCKMVQCCRCNGSGLCRNCSCVKAKRACYDCLPGRNDRCCNRASLITPCSPTPCSTTSVAPEVNTDASAALGLLSATSLASLGSTGHFWGPQEEVEESPQLEPTPGAVCPPLPSFKPASNSSFVWGECDSGVLVHQMNVALILKKRCIGGGTISRFPKVAPVNHLFRNSLDSSQLLHPPPLWKLLP